MVGRLKKIDKASLAGWLQQACTASSALLLVPVFVRCLGETQSGLWLTFQALVAVAGLADFGVAYVTSRQVAYALGREEGAGFSAAEDMDDNLCGISGIRETLRLARIANAMSCLIGAFILLLSVYLSNFDHNAGLGVSGVRWVVVLLGGTVLLRLWGRPFSAILDGSGDLYITRIVGAGQQLLMSAGAVVIVLCGGGLVIVGCWTMFTAILEYIIVRIVYVRKIGLVPALRVSHQDRKPLFRLVKVAYPLGLVNVGVYLISSIQLPFIAMTLGADKVTAYYVAQRIDQFFSMAISHLVLPKLPGFTRMLGMGNRIAARALFKNSGVQVFVLSIVGAFLMCSVLPIASIFYFKVSPLPIVAIFILGIDFVFRNSSVVFGQYVMAAGQNPFWRWILVAGVINFSILYLFLEKIGVVAIPLAMLISGCLTTYWTSLYYGKKLWKRLHVEERRAHEKGFAV